jgi:t-SNARE complex subunit (syntaxin)
VRDQVQIDANVDMNRMLMEDREQAMAGIAKDMHQVKQMFGELAGMVEGQADSVNKVAEHVDAGHERMAHGVKELQKADKKQQEGGGCVIC